MSEETQAHILKARVNMLPELDEEEALVGPASLDGSQAPDAKRELCLAALDLKFCCFVKFAEVMGHWKFPSSEQSKPPETDTSSWDVVVPGNVSGEKPSLETNGVSWDNPVIYLSVNYPLKDPKALIPPHELKDTAQALWWIGSGLNDELGSSKDQMINWLHTLTRGAAVVRRNGETNPVIPLALYDTYQTMSEEEQHAFLRRWYSWARLGDPWELETEDKQGAAVAASGSASHFGTATLPYRLRPTADASLTVEKGEATFRAAIVFDVSPLFIDLESGLANYLIRVGLPWEGDLGSPEHWSKGERTTMMHALFNSFCTLTNYYRSNETGPRPYELAVWERTPDASVTTAAQTTDTEALGNAALRENDLKATSPRILAPEEAVEKVLATTPRSRESMEIFPIALGVTSLDRDVAAVLNQAHKLALPREWSRIRKWDDIVREEIARWQEELGPKAYRDGPSGWKALLTRNRVAGQREEFWPTILTEHGEKAIKLRFGPKGYLKEDEKTLTQSFHQCVVGSDNELLLEMSIGWHGLAGPLVMDWRERQRRKIEEEHARLEEKRLPMFQDLDKTELARLDNMMRRINLYAKGQSFMEVILGQVLTQRRNPVEIRADVFKALLWEKAEPPQNWKQEVDGILNALRKIDIVVRAGGRKRIGGFLHYVDTEDEDAIRYVPRGLGGHGHGFYVLPVNEWFLGCLAAFEAGTTELRSGGEAVVLNFAKDLNKDEKKRVRGNFIQVNSGTPFYSAVAGHSPYQKNLVRFIESNITEKRDGLAGGRKSERRYQQVKKTDLEARLPRLYDSTFCPLLPEGRQYVAALGHWDSRAPESGFTLCGTKTAPRKNAGAKPGGLVEKMSRVIPSGRDKTRKAVIADTLTDLRRVVEEDFGGLVIGKLSAKDRTDGGDEPLWLTLDQFGELDEKRLLHRLKVLIFLPPDWNELRKAHFENVMLQRVTESPEEAEAAAWGDAKVETLPPGEIWGPENAWRGLSLGSRLYAAMKHRKLKQRDLARIFVVDPSQVGRWLAYGRGETDRTKAAPIPDDMAALMLRWIETEQEPSLDELEGLASRQRSPARRPKN